MKKTDSSPVSATAAVADRQGRFTRPPARGSILIIDAPDLDFESAHVLAAYRPRIVLNAAKSSTGRALGMGGSVLLGVGIPLIDDLGSDLLDIRDGETVTVQGEDVFTGDMLVASGRRVTQQNVAVEDDEARERLVSRVEAYALSSARDFGSEQALIVDGAGLPTPRVKMRGRIVLVATPTSNLVPVKKELYQFIGDHHPVIIAAGSGAAALTAVGLKPTVMVGDPRDTDPSALRKVRQVLVPTRGEEVPARGLLKRHSIDFDAVPTGLSATDVALLFAAQSGAAVVVDCSSSRSLAQFFDQSGLHTTGDIMVTTKLRNRLISLDALLVSYRPRLSGWWLGLLLLVAVAALAAALLVTPWGAGLIGLSTAGLVIPTVFPLTSSLPTRSAANPWRAC